MKRVFFDARLIHHPGIGRYSRSLLEAMLSQTGEIDWTLVGDPEALKHFALRSRVTIRPCAVPIYHPTEPLVMHRYFKGADLVHVPHFNVPLRLKAPLVVTLHDLIYFYVPEYQPFFMASLFLKGWFEHIARKASRIITVSQATESDCVRHFKRMSGKIEVIPEAAHAFFADRTASMETTQRTSSKPYIFYVGSIRQHKNIQGLIEGFERFRERSGQDVELILAGKLDHRFDMKYGFKEKVSHSPAIRFLGEVTDNELKNLYIGAACLVLPSFYEGFGLPVLEAMACGTPVLASQSTSLPEVAGDAGLFFDPYEPEQLAELLGRFFADASLREALSKKGLVQSQKFSWERSAEQTLMVYQTVFKENALRVSRVGA